MPEILVDRESVHAGDDCCSHKVSITVSESISIDQLVNLALEACPLPQVSGGKATWFAFSDTDPKQYLAVVAQQWAKPKLLPQAQGAVATIFRKQAASLVFSYWCQSDPEKVYEALANDTELPNRYTQKT